MPGINPSASVQVALVEIRSAGSVGRRPRRRTPAAAWVCGINPSVSVQGTPIVIRAALLGISRAFLPRHGDQRHRRRDQDPEDSAAHGLSPMCSRIFRMNHKLIKIWLQLRKPTNHLTERGRSKGVDGRWRHFSLNGGLRLRGTTVKPPNGHPDAFSPCNCFSCSDLTSGTAVSIGQTSPVGFMHLDT